MAEVYEIHELPYLDSNGELDPSTIPDRFDGFAATYGPFSYSAFQPSALATGTIDLGSLPAGFIITKVTIKHTTAFSGGALATAVVYIGVTGSLRRITTDFDVKQAVGNSKCQTTYGAIGFDSSSATTLKVTLDTTGLAMGLDDLIAGEFNVCIEMVKAPTAMAGGEHWHRFGHAPGGAPSIFMRPDDFANGDLVTYDSSLFKFKGLTNNFAPKNADYLVVNLSADLDTERRFVPRYHLAANDIGPNNDYVQDVQYFGHKVHEFFDDMMTVGFVDMIPLNGGTASGVAPGASPVDRAGVAVLSTGTTTTGYAAVATDFVAYLASSGEMIFEAGVRILNLADDTEKFIVRVGFGDAANADFTDGLYFEYAYQQSPNWRYCTAQNNTRTKNNSTTAVSTNWVRLKIVVNAAGNSVEFFVDGSSVGTITTNIPTVPSQEFGAVCHIVKEGGLGGIANRDLWVDYVAVRKVFDTGRSADWAV